VTPFGTLMLTIPNLAIRKLYAEHRKCYCRKERMETQRAGPPRATGCIIMNRIGSGKY